MESELKGAEKELVVRGSADLLQQKLRYIGRKTIAKYGCYGCHDIPGFEDAKPIGAGLNDWGRKEPSKLAFEHIVEYLHSGHAHGGSHGPGPAGKHGNGHGKPTATGGASETSAEEDRPGEQPSAHAAHGHKAGEHSDEELPIPDYYMTQINAGNRTGFIYQKLREPRSYDW